MKNNDAQKEDMLKAYALGFHAAEAWLGKEWRSQTDGPWPADGAPMCWNDFYPRTIAELATLGVDVCGADVSESHLDLPRLILDEGEASLA